MSTSNNAPPAVAKHGPGRAGLLTTEDQQFGSLCQQPFGAKDFVNLYSFDEFGIWSEKRRQLCQFTVEFQCRQRSNTDSQKSKFKNHGLNDKETR
jgi:hypothetical protein